ncbi:hypothetical protein V6N13_043052 [Hibiscus sabdariffa]
MKDNPWGRKAASAMAVLMSMGNRKGKAKGKADENMAKRREEQCSTLCMALQKLSLVIQVKPSRRFIVSF